MSKQYLKLKSLSGVCFDPHASCESSTLQIIICGITCIRLQVGSFGLIARLSKCNGFYLDI
jgi:hypothetical protein